MFIESALLPRNALVRSATSAGPIPLLKELVHYCFPVSINISLLAERNQSAYPAMYPSLTIILLTRPVEVNSYLFQRRHTLFNLFIDQRQEFFELVTRIDDLNDDRQVL